LALKDKIDKKPAVTRRDILKRGFYGGLSASLSSVLWIHGCRKPRQGTRPNIILIVLDTTRVDRLGCYGYHRQTSPNLDKLAAESVIYTKAIATSSWTLPSHASLFTGKFTSSHGARYDPEGPLNIAEAIDGPKSWKKYCARGLAKDELTLAMILKDAGYATAGVVGGPWLKRVFGLDKGFDYYDDTEISTLNGRLAQQVTEGAVNMIEKLNNKEFFLFLNYFDPHYPYTPPKKFASSFMPINLDLIDMKKPNIEEVNALYDAEILYMDHYIGRLIKRLKKDDLYDNTLIIVAADHGELLGEHNLFHHGLYLSQQEIHIPFFLKYPKGEVSPDRNNLYVQLTDILPMICERLAIRAPENIQGAVPSQSQHPIISETYPLSFLTTDGHWRALFKDDFKFHWNSKAKHMLHNLKNDPAEDKNLRQIYYEKSEKMEKELNQYVVNLPKPGPPAPAKMLDKQTKDALKSLGYVK